MMQKFVALFPWGANETWVDQRKVFYDVNYTGDYPYNGNGSNSFIIPVAASVAIYNSVPGHKIKCSTLPDYYGYINGGTSVQMPIGVNNDGTEVVLSAAATATTTERTNSNNDTFFIAS